jgi:hypothetical protein
MSTPSPEISLNQFNPASRTLQATDLFYVYQQQYGEVALPASLVLGYVQKYLGVGLFVTNGAPDDSEGFDGDYAVDLTMGIWYGPRTDGVWPGNTGQMVAGALSAALAAQITEQIQDAIIGGQGGPIIGSGAPTIPGVSGQLYFDLQNGIIYGPYSTTTNVGWGTGTAIIASEVTAALQQTLLTAFEAVLAASTGATKIGYNTTTVAAVLTTLAQQVAQLESGTSGTVLSLQSASSTLTNAFEATTVVFEGTGTATPLFTLAAGSTFGANSFMNVTNKAGNPSAVLTLQLSGPNDYFSTSTYSTTNTGITSISLNYGDTIKIGFTATGNIVLLDGTALLQFTASQASAPPLSDWSNRLATTGFGKTLRHGMIEIPASSSPVTVTTIDAAYAVLVFTGELSENTQVYLPNTSGTYTLRNETTGNYQLNIGLEESDTNAINLGVGLASYVMVRQGLGVFEVAAAEAVTSPTLTVYSTVIGNVTAGSYTIPVGNTLSSLTNVFANGAFLTRGIDFTIQGTNVVLTNPIIAGANYTVLSATLVNNSSLIYTPAIVQLTLPANQTSLSYPYPIGFVDVYVGGALDPTVVASDGQTLVFETARSTAQAITLRIYTPAIINGMLPISGGTVAGNLTVNGTVTFMQRPSWAGFTPIDTGNFGTLAVFQQGLPSSVARTLQAKLQESVSVLDFGADPTGTNDSSAAFQAALNSGARSVFVPPGKYLVGGLVMPTTVGFDLWGCNTASQLIQNSNTSPMIGWPTSSIAYTEGYIRNLSFKGTNGANHVIDTTGVGGISLYDLFITDVPTGYSGIHVNGAASTYTHDTRIRNLQIYSNTPGHSGVRFGPYSSDQQIDDMIMNGNFQVQYGIYFDVNAMTARISNSHPYNVAQNIIYAAGNNQSCAVTACTLDAANSDVVVLVGAYKWRFTDVYFEAIAANTNGVTISYTTSVSFMNCEWDSAVGANSAINEINSSNETKVFGGTIGTASNYTNIFNFIGAHSLATGVAGYNPLAMSYALVGCTTSAQAQNSTLYLGCNGGQASAVATAYTVPQSGLLASVYIAVATTPAAGQTFTFAIMDGSTQLGIGTIASGSYSVTITLNKAVAQYDQLYIQSVFSATSGSSFVRWVFNLTA